MLDCVNMLSNWDFPALGAPTIATSKRRFSLLVSADEDSGRIESGDRHDLVETKEKERRTRRFIVMVANEKANDENKKRSFIRWRQKPEPSFSMHSKVIVVDNSKGRG